MKDPVPHLPPRIPEGRWENITVEAFQAFEHITEEVWYPTKYPGYPGTAIQCGSTTHENLTCSDSVKYYDRRVNDHLTYFGIDGVKVCFDKHPKHQHMRHYHLGANRSL